MFWYNNFTWIDKNDTSTVQNPLHVMRIPYSKICIDFCFLLRIFILKIESLRQWAGHSEIKGRSVYDFFNVVSYRWCSSVSVYRYELTGFLWSKSPVKRIFSAPSHSSFDFVTKCVSPNTDWSASLMMIEQIVTGKCAALSCLFLLRSFFWYHIWMS